MSNATTATGTLTEAAGKVTLTLSSGDVFTTKDGNGFLGRLDRAMAAKGWRRNGYRVVGGIMTTEFARSAVLAG